MSLNTNEKRWVQNFCDGRYMQISSVTGQDVSMDFGTITSPTTSVDIDFGTIA